MFYRKKLFIFLFAPVLMLFPSCIKYYELSKQEFPQGKEYKDEREVVANNLKTASIYDEFETRAIFDVLWLSDETRETYVDLHCKKRGKDKQAKQALLRRQLEDNKHWTTFYILSDVRDKTHVSLTDKNSLWSLYLTTTDGQKITPVSIKESEVEPEYQSLFGPRFNSFKRAYMVKFPVSDLNGKPYLKEGESFKTVLSSPYKKREIVWREEDEENEGEKVLKNEDFYWI